MDISSIKLALMERLMLVWDEAALKRIATAIGKEISGEVGEDDFTEEEIAELDRRRARRLSSEGVGYPAEGSSECYAPHKPRMKSHRVVVQPEAQQ